MLLNNTKPKHQSSMHTFWPVWNANTFFVDSVHVWEQTHVIYLYAIIIMLSDSYFSRQSTKNQYFLQRNNCISYMACMNLFNLETKYKIIVLKPSHNVPLKNTYVNPNMEKIWSSRQRGNQSKYFHSWRQLGYLKYSNKQSN